MYLFNCRASLRWHDRKTQELNAMFYYQLGVTFLEVMISLALMSIGFLGLTRLEVLSLQAHYAAYYQSVATTQLVSMKNRLKVNFNRLANEVVLWNQMNQKLLPKGHGKVVCQSDHCHIDLSWQFHGQQLLSAVVQKNGTF